MSARAYRVGDRVVFEGRPSKVVAVSDRPGILTVSNYAGTWMISTEHTALVEACYVCDEGPHERTELHDYWPVSQAASEFARQDAGAGGSIPSMTAVETLDSREAVAS